MSIIHKNQLHSIRSQDLVVEVRNHIDLAYHLEWIAIEQPLPLRRAMHDACTSFFTSSVGPHGMHAPA